MFGSGGDGSKQFGSKGKKSPSAGKLAPQIYLSLSKFTFRPQRKYYDLITIVELNVHAGRSGSHISALMCLIWITVIV